MNEPKFLRVPYAQSVHGQEEIDAVDFLSMIKEKLIQVGLDESFIHRPVNDGFSGGEKKKD